MFAARCSEKEKNKFWVSAKNLRTKLVLKFAVINYSYESQRNFSGGVI